VGKESHFTVAQNAPPPAAIIASKAMSKSDIEASPPCCRTGHSLRRRHRGLYNLMIARLLDWLRRRHQPRCPVCGLRSSDVLDQ
jgi:hypothetical protein